MPVFFIDVHDGRRITKDRFGIELSDRYEAADQAAALLSDFAAETLPDGQSHDFAAAVRDSSGEVIYRSMLLFRGQWTARSEIVLSEALSECDYELARLKKILDEGKKLQQRFARTIPSILIALEKSKENREASQRARDERLKKGI